MSNEDNPNIGKQFEEIMGRNFTPEETDELKAKSNFNDEFATTDNRQEVENETEALSRFHDFPSHMVHYDPNNYGYHIKMTTPRGWTHIWSGGPLIEHQSRPGNTEDVTNMHDYSKPHDQQPYSKGISLPTFLSHVNEFETNAEDSFPEDHKPPKP